MMTNKLASDIARRIRRIETLQQILDNKMNAMKAELALELTNHPHPGMAMVPGQSRITPSWKDECIGLWAKMGLNVDSETAKLRDRTKPSIGSPKLQLDASFDPSEEDLEQIANIIKEI